MRARLSGRELGAAPDGGPSLVNDAREAQAPQARSRLEDHPLRYPLAGELHARPFPVVSAPSHAAFLAIKQRRDAASRDRTQDVAHLVALLDRFGAPHPQPGATHWTGEIGRHRLKWESHTEFVTYTLFGDGVADRPFDPRTFEAFPEDWLAEAPGVRITSALVRVEPRPDDGEVARRLGEWFVAESLAVSRVQGDCATIAGDFRIDPGGHVRFAVFVGPGTGERRVGRIVQRLCEIEVYKSMSMLGLARVRSMAADMAAIVEELGALSEEMAGEAAHADETLRRLLATTSRLEAMLARSAFRLSATRAYEALVAQRIEVMREERIGGRQTFAEFMSRRFDPSMRTVHAAERRLQAMADRGMRAAELLRTRVDVERSAQNQALLASMDRRADAQLRLQTTVEGLSVVAISYYAVSLALYLLGPLAEEGGVGEAWLAAIATPPVVLGVWWMVRRIRRRIH